MILPRLIAVNGLAHSVFFLSSSSSSVSGLSSESLLLSWVLPYSRPFIAIYKQTKDDSRHGVVSLTFSMRTVHMMLSIWRTTRRQLKM